MYPQFSFVFYVLLLNTYNVIDAKPPTKIEPVVEKSAIRLMKNESVNNPTRIIGGYAAYDFQFPWAAYITMDDKYMCGGTLISSRHVLTSAATIKDYSKFEVLLFNGDLDNKRGDIVEFTSQTRVFHPAYYSLAIIVAPFSVITNQIRPIRLPALSQIYDDFLGMEAVVAGWGYVNEESKYANGFLKYTPVTIMSNSECSRSLTGVQNYMMCTSGYGHACIGDQGGPLQIKERDGSWTLVGTLYAVVPKKCSLYPSVSLRITSFLPWIANIAGINLRP